MDHQQNLTVLWTTPDHYEKRHRNRFRTFSATLSTDRHIKI